MMQLNVDLFPASEPPLGRLLCFACHTLRPVIRSVLDCSTFWANLHVVV
jgi:hypothetical protein